MELQWQAAHRTHASTAIHLLSPTDHCGMQCIRILQSPSNILSIVQTTFAGIRQSLRMVHSKYKRRRKRSWTPTTTPETSPSCWFTTSTINSDIEKTVAFLEIKRSDHHIGMLHTHENVQSWFTKLINKSQSWVFDDVKRRFADKIGTFSLGYLFASASFFPTVRIDRSVSSHSLSLVHNAALGEVSADVLLI